MSKDAPSIGPPPPSRSVLTLDELRERVGGSLQNAMVWYESSARNARVRWLIARIGALLAATTGLAVLVCSLVSATSVADWTSSAGARIAIGCGWFASMAYWVELVVGWSRSWPRYQRVSARIAQMHVLFLTRWEGFSLAEPRADTLAFVGLAHSTERELAACHERETEEWISQFDEATRRLKSASLPLDGSKEPATGTADVKTDAQALALEIQVTRRKVLLSIWGGIATIPLAAVMVAVSSNWVSVTSLGFAPIAAGAILGGAAFFAFAFFSKRLRDMRRLADSKRIVDELLGAV